MNNKLFILCLLCLTPFSLNADDELPRSGLYAITTNISSSSPIPKISQSSQHCLKSEDFARDPSQLLGEQMGNAKDCQITTFTMQNNKIELVMHCTPDGGNMKMKTTGNYSPDSYRISTDMQLEMNGTLMEMNSETEGKRVGDC